MTKGIAKRMFNENTVNKTEVVSLSNNRLSCRINDFSNYEIDKLLKKKNWILAIQLDGYAKVLLIYVMYIFTYTVLKDLHFTKTLKTYTNGEAILDTIDRYFQKNWRSWFYCLAMCTWCAKSMTRTFSGFVTRIQRTHCYTYRQALVYKCIPAELSTALRML